MSRPCCRCGHGEHIHHVTGWCMVVMCDCEHLTYGSDAEEHW